MHYLPGARRVAGFLLVSLLAGCSGGGGDDDATGMQISTNAISFSAAAPDAATPAAQVFTATFGEDIAHLAVINSGDAVAGVTSTMNGRTAQITVTPTAPSTVGPGAFTGAVAVTGYTCADSTCSRLSAGSTSTVAVSYQVSPVVQLVTPYVAISGVSDSVVIRGIGLGSFSVQGARFGDIAATSITAVSATEFRATYPALAAGTYTVRLNSSNHQGEIPSNATLVVVDPVAYAATTLSYSVPANEARRIVYDAERRALIAVNNYGDGSIVRYAYDGAAWSAPVNVVTGLRDVALSAKGTQLYGITNTAVTPVDPITLALGTAVTAPSPPANSYLKNIVVGNDDRALITTGISSSTATTGYLYDPVTAAVVQNGVALNNATPAMAANGATAIVSQGDPTLTADIAVYSYATSSNALATTSVSLRQNTVAPAVDRAVTRVILNGLRVYGVVNNDLSLFGTLPDTTTAVVMKPNGTRAYTYDPTAGGIVTYDVSVDRDEAAYVALGAATPLAGNPGSGVKMIITPDGGTLFLAGSDQIVVQPTPAL